MKLHLHIFLVIIILSSCIDNSKQIKSENRVVDDIPHSFILDSTDYEIINEAIFQSATISPTLSHRYNKNVHFTIDEIKQNLKNFVIIDSTYYW